MRKISLLVCNFIIFWYVSRYCMCCPSDSISLSDSIDSNQWLYLRCCLFDCHFHLVAHASSTFPLVFDMHQEFTSSTLSSTSIYAFMGEGQPQVCPVKPWRSKCCLVTLFWTIDFSVALCCGSKAYVSAVILLWVRSVHEPAVFLLEAGKMRRGFNQPCNQRVFHSSVPQVGDTIIALDERNYKESA